MSQRKQVEKVRRDGQVPVSLFCDFDGTISSRDIGFDLFDTYGMQEPLHGRLKRGELPIQEYWREIVKTVVEPSLSHEELDRYLRQVPPDRGAADLFDLIERAETPFTIVSDGMDLYISRWMEIHGLPAKRLFCNHAELMADGEIRVSFPYASEECDCSSAVCKRNLLLGMIGEVERVIYIGDGMSDFCPAELADVIFAKGELAAYCNANGLPHHSWKSLTEVVPLLEKLLAGKRIRARKRALNARKRAWSQG